MDDKRHIPLGPGSEFDIVRRMLDIWGDLASGVGDDAASLTVPPGESLVVSTDTSVDDVHFRAKWLSPSEIGYRATTAALSDLAAMGATPLGILVALTVPREWVGQVDHVARGIGDAVRVAGTVIRGGDLTAGREFTLSLTVLGSARQPLTRAGVVPGDHIYLTGVLTGPVRAVRAWEAGEEPAPWCRERFARPVARIREARWLAQQGAHAAIDVSDGLGSELLHLAQASDVELRIDADRIPAGHGGSWEDALRGGEEYELVVASPIAINADAFARAHGVPLTRIGEARRAAQPDVVIRRQGTRVEFAPGHDHFSS